MDKKKISNLLENLFIVILAFYPLRHIGVGLDLWDTGYNYANFQYMGTGNMDSMWFFSTYLANVTGNFLTKLPSGDTLMGMNLYTGLTVSLMALIGYFFCTRKLKMPKFLAFAGEMAAVSLCWCPTALLYNYLTYLFFLLSSILLYLGLTGEKKVCLFLAGVFLGANVLVRFSNLPEAAMILAVWAYDLILWREEKACTPAGQEKSGKSLLNLMGRHTLWCLAGYAAAVLMLFLGIEIRYGMGEYTEGIRRLFAMTENASDYQALSMVKGIFKIYGENLYWVFRIGFIALCGVALFAAAERLEKLCLKRIRGNVDKQGQAAADRKEQNSGSAICQRGIHAGVRFLWVGVCAAMLVWLYAREFCSFYFYSYDSIWRPGPIFLMLALLSAVVCILHKGSSREEKLVSGMMILIIMLTSIGSNNGVLPSLNNLFLAGPYTLWQCWKFFQRGDLGLKGGWVLSWFPVKGVLGAFLILCLFQFGCFGAKFVFAESTGVQDAAEMVENNAVLRNIKMEGRKARWMRELSAYVNENNLEGREVLLYGWIPAVSYYLQMPYAMNPWSELDSYVPEVMEKDLAELKSRITKKQEKKPVIILENKFALYEEGGLEAMEAAGLSQKDCENVEKSEKWLLFLGFMEEQGYTQAFRNEKFALYR